MALGIRDLRETVATQKKLLKVAINKLNESVIELMSKCRHSHVFNHSFSRDNISLSSEKEICPSCGLRWEWRVESHLDREVLSKALPKSSKRTKISSVNFSEVENLIKEKGFLSPGEIKSFKKKGL